MHKRVYLSLGSNVGDRAANLNTAIDRLGTLGKVVAVSSFYETEPVEFAAQPWFLNCAVELDTEKMPRQLLAGFSTLKKKWDAGEYRKKARAPSTSTYFCLGTRSSRRKGLTIPHPAMHQRRFVLEPLAEIAPEARHPVFKRTVRELRDALPPGQAVKRTADLRPQTSDPGRLASNRIRDQERETFRLAWC